MNGLIVFDWIRVGMSELHVGLMGFYNIWRSIICVCVCLHMLVVC